jgi:hypothetical protein
MSKDLFAKPEPGRNLAERLAAAIRAEAAEEFPGIAVRLFTWLIQHEQIEKLDGLAVLSRAFTVDDPSIITLVADHKSPDDIPLSPIDCWPSLARSAVDLFSKRLILSDNYYSAVPDTTAWDQLAKRGYVRLEPLYRTHRLAVTFIPDDLPTANGRSEHSSKDPVQLSALAFFEKQDSGLDAVRRSKVRSVELLLFLSNYVLSAEPDALTTYEAACECGGTHNYYFSSWIASMLERRWVPIGHKQAFATAESIAQLFKGYEDKLRELISGNGRYLLRTLGISLSDLRLRTIAEDEDTRVEWIGIIADIAHAVDNDLGKIRLLATEVKETPTLLDEIQVHRERREAVRRRSWLVEVNATTQDVARMTVAQARAAIENLDGFVLCVVQLDGVTPVSQEVLKERCHFVVDIGRRIQPIWNNYSRFEETKGEVRTSIDDIELYVEEGQVRFAIGSEVWENGLPFDEFVSFIQIGWEE